jgi:hypothetical protein
MYLCWNIPDLVGLMRELRLCLEENFEHATKAMPRP